MCKVQFTCCQCGPDNQTETAQSAGNQSTINQTSEQFVCGVKAKQNEITLALDLSVISKRIYYQTHLLKEGNFKQSVKG